MKVDVQSLGTFNRLAHEGAKQATRSMAQMTGIDASVEVTKISLVDRAEVGEALGSEDFVGVQFGFDGGLSGETVLVFERDCTDDIVDALPGSGADPELAKSSVEEVGNVMMSGFIDGWADYLETAIEHTPPEYIERTGAEVVPDAPETGDADQIFLFRSEVEWFGESVNFYIYMLPEYESMSSLLAEHATDDAIPIEKLEAFNELTRTGTETAAEHVEMMTGIETEAEVSRISFCPIEDVPKQVENETYVGTVVELTGLPSGYLLVLFDEASAVTVAEAVMPMEVSGSGVTEKHESAIKELGNIMTSGFVDGWANVLQESVDHTPPRLVHDMGRAIVDPIAAQLGQNQRHAFVVDSTMRTDEVDFESEIYALPDEKQLRDALDTLSTDRTDQTEADVEQIF